MGVSNPSGVTPVHYKVLVLPDTVPDKAGEIIFRPPSNQDREQHAQEFATFIEASEMAFTKPEWPVTPKPGDRVMIGRYTGKVVRGADGLEYKVIQDEDILAIIGEDVEYDWGRGRI